MLPCFRVFFGFFWFSQLRNPWKPKCLITDVGYQPGMKKQTPAAQTADNDQEDGVLGMFNQEETPEGLTAVWASNCQWSRFKREKRGSNQWVNHTPLLQSSDSIAIAPSEDQGYQEVGHQHWCQWTWKSWLMASAASSPPAHCLSLVVPQVLHMLQNGRRLHVQWLLTGELWSFVLIVLLVCLHHSSSRIFGRRSFQTSICMNTHNSVWRNLLMPSSLW